MHTGIKINSRMHTGICRCDGANSANRRRSQRRSSPFTAAMAVIVKCGGS
jgi:hypothetical protein